MGNMCEIKTKCTDDIIQLLDDEIIYSKTVKRIEKHTSVYRLELLKTVKFWEIFREVSRNITEISENYFEKFWKKIFENFENYRGKFWEIFYKIPPKTILSNTFSKSRYRLFILIFLNFYCSALLICTLVAFIFPLLHYLSNFLCSY